MAFPYPVLPKAIQNIQEALWQNPLSCSFLFFSFFILLWLNRPRVGKSVRLPPSPTKLPIIGHLHHLGTPLHRSLQALSKKYGPLMLLNLGQIPTLVVQSAEMAKEVMKTHDLIFSNRPSTTASKTLTYEGKDVAFAPYGEHWRQMRRLCILDLLSIKRVESFRFVREDEIGKLVGKIKQSSSMGKEVNLSDLVLTVTNNIISRVALGRSLDGDMEKSVYAGLIKDAAHFFGNLTVADMFPSLKWIDMLTGVNRRMETTSKSIFQFIDEVIDEHLKARKENCGRADRKDFIDVLLDYEEDYAKSGVGFTRENFRAVVMDMFVAGTETTFTTVEWLMAELVNHPNVMKKLQEEVHRVVGSKSKLDEDQVKKMDYLKCVIKETLRLHAPLALSIPRESTESTTINGYHVPAKTRVMTNVWAIGRDPKIWEEPEQFIPERFINNSVDFKGNDFEFIPFGAGRRGCPGISFGVSVVESVVANLVYWFDWKLPGGGSNKVVDMTEAFAISVTLKTPLRLVPISHTF